MDWHSIAGTVCDKSTNVVQMKKRSLPCSNPFIYDPNCWLVYQLAHCSDFIFSYTVAVDCGNLANPTNGRVDLTGTTFGSIATYTCNSGFILANGNRIRQCGANEQWSGTAPNCVRKLLHNYNPNLCHCAQCSYVLELSHMQLSVRFIVTMSAMSVALSLSLHCS